MFQKKIMFQCAHFHQHTMKRMRSNNTNTKPIQTLQYLRIKDAAPALGVKPSTVYLWIKNGTLPPLINLGGRTRAMPLHEINAINAARLVGKTDSDLKGLVKTLVSQRQNIAKNMEQDCAALHAVA